MTAEEAYLDKLISLASSRSPLLRTLLPWSKADLSKTRSLYWHRNDDLDPLELGSADEILVQCQLDVAQRIPSIFLVEEISPRLIALLGVAFNVEPECWLSYIDSPSSARNTAAFASVGETNVAKISRQAAWSPEHAQGWTPAESKSDPQMKYTGQLGKICLFAENFNPCCNTRFRQMEYGEGPSQSRRTGVTTNVTYFTMADTVCE